MFTDTQVKLSDDVVYDILNDILGLEGSSFMHLKVPSFWCSRWNAVPNENLSRLLDNHDHVVLKQSSCYYFGFAGNREEFIRQIQSRGSSGELDMIEQCNWCRESYSMMEILICVLCNQEIHRGCICADLEWTCVK